MKKFTEGFYQTLSPSDLEGSISSAFIGEKLTQDTYNLIVEKWAESVKNDLINKLHHRDNTSKFSENKIITGVNMDVDYDWDFYGNLDGMYINLRVTGDNNEK